MGKVLMNTFLSNRWWHLAPTFSAANICDIVIYGRPVFFRSTAQLSNSVNYTDTTFTVIANGNYRRHQQY